MQKYPSISLIITTYNRKDALELVLMSVMQQTVLPNEVIIADDGSKEDTAQMIKEYAQKFPVPLKHCWQEDDGFKLAMIRNKAIAMSNSLYIIMIDGDMVLGKNFVKSHQKVMRPNQFVQGSRVLLSEKTTQKALKNKFINFNWTTKGILNRFNAMNIPLLSPVFSKRKLHKEGVRGANMAFWKEDVIKVNGFNEEFVGWGREDSEFVLRLLNNGTVRYNLKFGGVAFHLYHPENSRNLLNKNDLLLEKAEAEKSKFCQKGINQYLK
ncbi:MAG: glycosyltransferase family 2 protein [Flammeovirgaceae bacterium]